MRAPLVLFVALLGISFAGPLVRYAGADPLAIATGRLGFSMLLLLAPLLISGQWRELRTLGRGDLLLASGAGVALAVHFWSWIASLGMTTIAASVVLVSLQPVGVAILSALLLRESPSRGQWIGVAIAMCGALVVGWGDARGGGAAGSNALLGDLLALVGAATAAIYYVAGRSLRQRLGIWSYVAVVYGACFATLVALCVGRGVPLVGYPSRDVLVFALLAAGPMMLGHTGMNWALRALPAYIVNLTVLGEPVGATLLAWMLPGIGEVPGTETVVGGAIILGGVVVAAWPRRERTPAERPAA